MVVSFLLIKYLLNSCYWYLLILIRLKTTSAGGRNPLRLKLTTVVICWDKLTNHFCLVKQALIPTKFSFIQHKSTSVRHSVKIKFTPVLMVYKMSLLTITPQQRSFDNYRKVSKYFFEIFLELSQLFWCGVMVNNHIS